MKKTLATIMLLLFLVAGCQYNIPLDKNAKIPVKDELLGLWEFVSSPGAENSEKFTMLVMRQNDFEYIVRYGEEKDPIYVRAYHVELNGLASLIQIQCIGVKDKPVYAKDNPVYDLIQYTIKGDNLEIKTLNPDIVDKDCKSSEELKKQILANKDNKKLFANPGAFRKISKQPAK